MSFLGAPDDGDVNSVFSAEPPAGGAGLALTAAKETAPPAAQESAPPLVDPFALQDLGSQLDNPHIAQGFARDYASLWDQRYRALATSLDSEDEAAALDAVLSLKTSSAMVGGVRLTELAKDLETAIRLRDADSAQRLLEEIAESGTQTIDELQVGYLKER